MASCRVTFTFTFTLRSLKYFSVTKNSTVTEDGTRVLEISLRLLYVVCIESILNVFITYIYEEAFDKVNSHIVGFKNLNVTLLYTCRVTCLTQDIICSSARHEKTLRSGGTAPLTPNLSSSLNKVISFAS